MLLYYEEKEKEYQGKSKKISKIEKQALRKARDMMMKTIRKNEDFSEQKFSGSFLGENDEYL